MHINDMGQSSIYDAMTFLCIMLVASGLIVGLSVHLMREDDVHAFEELQNYARRLSNALLSSTVPNASYMDVEGMEIVSRDISVQDMIAQELLLLESGVPEGNFLGDGKYNAVIESVLSSLLDRDRFNCGLYAVYKGHEVAFGDQPPGTARETAAQCTLIHLSGDENEIGVTLYIWR